MRTFFMDHATRRAKTPTCFAKSTSVRSFPFPNKRRRRSPASRGRDASHTKRLQRRKRRSRTRTATLTVDASRCAETTGRFEIKFVRVKEFGPDLVFTENSDGPGIGRCVLEFLVGRSRFKITGLERWNLADVQTERWHFAVEFFAKP